MKIKASFSAKETQRALQEYSRATKKDEAEVLNRACRNVVIKAFKGTQQASAAKIRSYLSADNFRMAGIILAKRGALKGLTRAQADAKVKRVVNASVRSVRYIKIGWAKAGQAFGAFANMKVNSKSEAAKGFGKKATSRSLIAEIANNSRGAEKVALAPLQQARSAVSADMLAYAKRKMQQTANKFSAKK